jgi:alkanesulfonate monooxygenase SsuD/methylene tetrahydromethanopterin reductase-like flavin-dependent oxidoreductase (luciferase family)
MQVGVMISSYNTGDWDRLMKGEYDHGPEIPDAHFVEAAFHIGNLVEPLGFDSIWSTEHYGSAYSMNANPLQWLAYWAGRTQRVDLGTAVIVLPWWNPVRLAHELAMLDLMAGPDRRLLLGLGRGVSEHEYASLGVPRESSREYFHEILSILRLADERQRFSYDGEFFQIPDTTIRPQSRRKGSIMDGARCAFATRASADQAAEAGLGQLFTAGEPLSVMAERVAMFNAIRATKGLPPDQPTSMFWMYCADTEEEAEEGFKFFSVQNRTSKNHYFRWNTSGFAGVKGYEEYAQKKGADVGTWEQRACQPIGTPDQVIEKIRAVQEAVSLGYLVVHASYGGMPPDKAEKSMRLFAKEVLPALHEMPTPLHAHSIGEPAAVLA